MGLTRFLGPQHGKIDRESDEKARFKGCICDYVSKGVLISGYMESIGKWWEISGLMSRLKYWKHMVLRCFNHHLYRLPVDFPSDQVYRSSTCYTPISCRVHQSTGTFPLIKVRLKLGMQFKNMWFFKTAHTFIYIYIHITQCIEGFGRLCVISVS